jgi:hypothetical protein
MNVTFVATLISATQEQSKSYANAQLQLSFLVDELAAKRSRPPLERIKCTCSYIDTCQCR